jgi:aspartokinase/homoserine dehydrogenase 1
MRFVAGLIRDAAREASIVVVTSAMGGLTDDLVAAAARAAARDEAGALEAVARIVAYHRKALDQLGGTTEPAVADGVKAIGAELTELARATALIGELTARTRDRFLASGEKLAARLLALALRARGVDAVPVDADTFLETDGRFGSANALAGVADRTTVVALRPLLDAGRVPVVTGFCGRAPDGATTTLGRGGSDLSATLLAAALGAHEVTIWTDVDGVFSADPRRVPTPRVLEHLNYREAGELAFYGANVLHQRTMIPVVAKGIPVRIRSSYRPEAPGTRVDGRFTPGSHPVKAISAIPGLALVSLEGKGMAGVPGVAARAFGSLAARAISVTMISQSSAESSISLAVPASAADDAEVTLKREFRPEIGRGEVEDVVVLRHVALVAAVGLGMAHHPGIAGRVFGAVGRQRVNVLAIAQGPSELNITLAVEERQVDRALAALHQEFGLDRRDTGVDTTRRLDLLLLGCGNIGRAFVELVLERRAHVFERFGLHPQIVAIADRSGYLFRPTGLAPEELAEVLDAKAAGRPLTELGAVQAGAPAAMVREALAYRLARPVLVDVSDAAEATAAFREALRRGCDVVTANKKPLADDYEAFAALLAEARQHGRLLKAEATVGAGLPIVDTLEMLLATGDQLRCAEGVLSGTLAFLLMRLEAGARFSEAVAEAVRRGYTEPDPVVDLSGADVARKAVILGRLSGLLDGAAEVALEGLVDPSWMGLPRDELFTRLQVHDEPLAARVAAAKAAGHVLRYVARVERGRARVGLEAVPRESPLAGLRGTDNMVVFHSERYDERPLVVTGPGAGIDVTAMGVLGDVLRIAAERGDGSAPRLGAAPHPAGSAGDARTAR